MNVFDIVKIIRSKPDSFSWEEIEPEYNSFIINRAMSFDLQSILFANELNKTPDIDKKWQFHFLLNTIQQSKRFIPWIKRGSEEDVDSVREIFNCSRMKAQEILAILPPDQLLKLKQKLKRGGRVGKSN